MPSSRSYWHLLNMTQFRKCLPSSLLYKKHFTPPNQTQTHSDTFKSTGVFIPVWRLENSEGQGCHYLGSVVTQVEWIWRRNERKFVRPIIHGIIQWLGTTGHQHSRVNRSHTVMDHDILERRTISREIQAECYVWCRSLYVTLEKNEVEKLF